MKSTILKSPWLSVSALVLTQGLAVANSPREQFLSSIQFAVHESTPQLMQRSQQIVQDEFANAFGTYPELKGKTYQIRQNGNEVFFFMTTDNDMRTPMQGAVAAMVEHLNGRVLARGKSMFYKAAFSKPVDGYLEVTTDDTHSGILSIAAQSVPLRDVLKEIKAQVGSISYLIPGECAEQLVDWSFGENGEEAAKPVDTVMSELATLFNLKFEKKNGTYIFSGTCDELKRERTRPPVELLRNGFLPPSISANGTMGARMQHVFVPIFPFSE